MSVLRNRKVSAGQVGEDSLKTSISDFLVIYDDVSVSCILRRIRCENAPDCSETPRTGGLACDCVSKNCDSWLGDNGLASLACFSESYRALRHTPGENVDFVTKFEKALRERYQHLKTELAKIEHLIDAFEKGAKRGAKPTGRSKISAAGRKRISMAQKARWAKRKKG